MSLRLPSPLVVVHLCQDLQCLTSILLNSSVWLAQATPLAREGILASVPLCGAICVLVLERRRWDKSLERGDGEHKNRFAMLNS